MSQELSQKIPKTKYLKKILEKIRQKSSSVAKGLILVGGLSVSSCKMDKYSPGAEPDRQPTELALYFSEKRLSEKDYFLLCESNAEKAFVTAPLYASMPWLGDALKLAAEKEPETALVYGARYSDVSEYNEIIALVINALDEQEKKMIANGDEYIIKTRYILMENIDAWINTPSAHKILVDNADDKYFFVPNFKKYPNLERVMKWDRKY
ncbi:MAG: hypothetical protein Q8Q67_01185 [bacterium]|nr:hypothetical protein [bacterium]